MRSRTYSRSGSIAVALAALAAGLPFAAGQPQVMPASSSLEPTLDPGPAGPHTNQDDCPDTAAARRGVPNEIILTSVIYVDQNAVGSNTGRCWKNAFVDLQWALADAAQRTTPVEIWVADGAYLPDGGSGNPFAAFALLDDVAVYGGFTGSERSRPQRNPDPLTNGTLLSGMLLTNQDPPVRSAHVVVSIANGRSAVLDGFGIAYGQSGALSGPGAAHGAGAQLLGSSAILRNCVFAINETSGMGGALYIDGGAPLLQTCGFYWNTAALDGGAVAVVGDAIPALHHCTFYGNAASGNGGGLFTGDDSAGWINGCTIVANTAGSGGAMHHALRSGPIVVNCLINGNEAALGGAITYADFSGGLLLNSTVTSNRAMLGTGVAFISDGPVVVRNSILWRNHDLLGDVGPQFHTNQDNGDPDITYSLVAGWASGVGNLSGDPRFRDFDGLDNVPGNLDDNLRLSGLSPCIDAADNTAWYADGIAGTVLPLDLDLQPRFRDDPLTIDKGVGPPPIVDMGAYEYNRTASPAPPEPGSP